MRKQIKIKILSTQLIILTYLIIYQIYVKEYAKKTGIKEKVEMGSDEIVIILNNGSKYYGKKIETDNKIIIEHTPYNVLDRDWESTLWWNKGKLFVAAGLLIFLYTVNQSDEIKSYVKEASQEALQKTIYWYFTRGLKGKN